MKTLKQMNYAERAYLLAGLFPEELPGILITIHEKYTCLQAQEETIRNQWDNSMITVADWYDLAKQAHEVVKKYKSKLLEKRRLFADQLFDGTLALFTIDCIVEYARKGNGGPRFQEAIKMFFGNHP